ncbi:MAG: hypothetical protein PVF21_07700 [Thiohalophilus sp.]|jgi:hypothetical protein
MLQRLNELLPVDGYHGLSWLWGLGLLFLLPFSATAKPSHESDDLVVNLTPRTPQQIAAFYEGRGFSEAMIDVLRKQCFITVFIRNRSRDIIWLDLQHWKFTNTNGVIIRRDREYWKARWQKMGIPLAHQSTFRWTLLPEQLNFLPDEREGGNIILPRDSQTITLHARFDTGQARDGKPIQITLDNLQCANNP